MCDLIIYIYNVLKIGFKKNESGKLTSYNLEQQSLRFTRERVRKQTYLL